MDFGLFYYFALAGWPLSLLHGDRRRSSPPIACRFSAMQERCSLFKT
jgi:hypothetical protein